MPVKKRTDDAMAVLMSASLAAVPRRIIPTPVRFGRVMSGAESAEGNLGTDLSELAPDTGWLESDSSAKLERSQAGPRGPSTAGTSVGPERTAYNGQIPTYHTQDESEVPVSEVDPVHLPAALIQAMTTQVTASIMQYMESLELTRRLAQRLDTQEAHPKIVNEVFLSVLTPDRYRLENQTGRVLEAMRNTSHRAIRSMKTLMKRVPMFGGPN
eukprot:contig_12255_g2928